jgi:predicted transposase YbfD/YdcC
MDQSQYSTLSEALAHVSDPRKARGKRYAWHFLLMLIALAMASGQRSVHAIADWILLHADEIRKQFELDDDAALPSESTLRRTLRVLDTTQFETVIAALAPPSTPATAEPAPLRGQAIDGKQLRGVRAHGEPHHLVSLVQHADARIAGQVAVAEKSNEITAVPPLLAGRDLSGTVTTVDAILTQRTIAQQILEQKGHYLMVVKSNQGELYHAIEFLFANPPWTKHEQLREYWKYRTSNKGHGRIEHRTLETSTALCGYLDWPQVGQVMRRTCRRIQRKTGVVSAQVRYAITSLKPNQASAADLERLWRGHWTIENKVHYVRDVTLGEDAGQVRAGNAPHNLAAMRNALLNLFRANGWCNMSDALRYYGSKVSRAFALLTTSPARL